MSSPPDWVGGGANTSERPAGLGADPPLRRRRGGVRAGGARPCADLPPEMAGGGLEPALRSGDQDPRTQQRLAEISTTLQAYVPDTQTQISFYDSAVLQVNDLVTEQHDRVSGAETSVPGALV